MNDSRTDQFSKQTLQMYNISLANQKNQYLDLLIGFSYIQLQTQVEY